MKHEILDSNFNSELRNQLQEGEKVIWEGRPYQNRYVILLFLIPFIYFLILMFFDFYEAIKTFFFVFIFSIGFSYNQGELKKFFARKYNKYLITNRRVIFQTRKNKQLHFQSIPFEDITYPSVYPNMLGRKSGTIFLNIKKSSSTSLILKDLKSSIEEDNRPTLIMIDDVKRSRQIH